MSRFMNVIDQYQHAALMQQNYNQPNMRAQNPLAGLGSVGIFSGGLPLVPQQQTKPVEKPKAGENKMGFIKEYFTKHKELFMGLAIAVILDRYLLGGAFQERLKRIITGLLDKTEASLSNDKQKA